MGASISDWHDETILEDEASPDGALKTYSPPAGAAPFCCPSCTSHPPHTFGVFVGANPSDGAPPRSPKNLMARDPSEDSADSPSAMSLDDHTSTPFV